jgi:preprotein translocase subunit Sss1
MKTNPIHEAPARFWRTARLGELFPRIRRTFNRNARLEAARSSPPKKEWVMGDITGLAAVIMIFGIPLTGMALYAWYRVSKLRTEERMAALARGVNVPMEPELSQSMRSRRSGILLVAGAIGYIITFTLIARVEPDAWVVASFGAIPFTLGLGYFLDSTLIRRDLRSSS